MPVLINVDTKLAENRPKETVMQDLHSGKYEVPLVDQDGNMGSATLQDYRQLKSEGTHVDPSEPQVQHLLKYAKYSSTPEQLKTIAEGAADAMTLGASNILEDAAGSDPADRLGRREINPGLHALGSAGGIALGAVLSAGADLPLTPIQAAESLAGTASEMSGAGNIVRAAIKSAAGAATAQASDEVSRMFQNDPKQTVQSALINTGLGGLLGGIVGGGLESGGELWNAVKAPKVNDALEAARQAIAEEKGNVIPFPSSEVPGAEAAENPTANFLKDKFKGLLRKGAEYTAFGMGSKLGGPFAGALARDLVSKGIDSIPEGISLAAERFGQMLPEVHPGAFKSVSEFASNAIQGVKTVNRAIANVLGPEASLGIRAISDREFNNITKAAGLMQQDPAKFLSMNKDLGVYEPNHADAQTQLVVSALNAVSSLRPKNTLNGLLDNKNIKSKAQEREFRSNVNLIANPSYILKDINSGTVTQQKAMLVKTLYPEFANSLVQKLTEKVIDHTSKDKMLSYKHRLSISLYTGTPLDSTMTPQAIAMNQANMGPSASQQQQQQPKPPSQAASKAFTDFSKTFQTQSQAREAHRIMR